MDTVSVARTFDAPADRVRSVLDDSTAFFEAAGFEVERDGDRLELTKQVAVKRIELNVRLRDDEAAELAYEQLTGPFEAMETRYVVDSTPSGGRLTIETSFEPPASGFGTFLTDAAVEQQRQAELNAVESQLAADGESAEQSGHDRPVESGGN